MAHVWVPFLWFDKLSIWCYLPSAWRTSFHHFVWQLLSICLSKDIFISSLVFLKNILLVIELWVDSFFFQSNKGSSWGLVAFPVSSPTHSFLGLWLTNDLLFPPGHRGLRSRVCCCWWWGVFLGAGLSALVFGVVDGEACFSGTLVLMVSLAVFSGSLSASSAVKLIQWIFCF